MCRQKGMGSLQAHSLIVCAQLWVPLWVVDVVLME